MIGWTNMADGGINIQNGKAVIHVLAQVGSTINFLKDGITIILEPDKSFVDIADNDLAHWYYSVNSSNYGTWTVTATLGTYTVSDTVTVDSNKEYELMLFTFWLYYYGNTRDTVTGGYQAISKRASDASYGNKAPNITYNSDNMYISFPTESSGYVCTNNSIDVTNFNTLCALVDLTSSRPTNGNYYFGLLPSTTYTYWYSYLTPYIALGPVTPGTGVEINVDISAVIGNQYITFAQNSNVNSRINVYKMWLE